MTEVILEASSELEMEDIMVKEEERSLSDWWKQEEIAFSLKQEPTDSWDTTHNLFDEFIELDTTIHLDDFQNWMEEPMDVGGVVYGGRVEPPPSEELIREFEAVLSSTTATLTPPDSPDPSIFTIIQDLSNPRDELDKLVAERVEDLISSGGSSCGGSSPRGDPDWSPSGGESGNEEYPVVRRTAGRNSERRVKSGVEERRQRKKEQNRDAATRYRLKKKKEAEGILGEEKVLQDRNADLTLKLADLKKEVSLLKSLMREVYKKKGLIK